MLVDSSVLVDYFSRQRGRAWRLFERALQAREPVFVTPVVLQEVLQGARDEHEFGKIRESLRALACLEPHDAIEAANQAAHLYARCRWGAVTIRSPIDCLIAVTAVQHGVPLLTEDRDFVAIRRFLPGLKLIELPADS